MKRTLASLAIFLVTAGTASAATLSYSGSSQHTLTGFDLTATTGLTNGTKIFREAKREGRKGDGLYISGPANLKLTYLGKEAGNTNTFRMPGTTEIFRTGTSHVGDTANVHVGKELLNFNFLELSTLGAFWGDIANGEGADKHQNAIGVFMESVTSAILLFNDFGNDKDYDDMAVRIEVSPIPVPAALPLFASAVAGLGYAARRRTANATA
jgi:hypothetical protein